MPAANTDLFKKTTNNFSTTLTSSIGSGDATMSLAATTNLPTDTGIDLVIDRVNASGTATPATREYVKGTVSGGNVINLVRGLGNSTAQAHSTGAVIEQVWSATTATDLMTGILTQHTQAGAHTGVTTDSLTATGVVNASTVSSLQDTSVALSTYRNESSQAFVASGGVWTGDSYGSTKNASMTAAVVYINGQRSPSNQLTAVTARVFTASKDTYIDVLNTAGVFSLVYTEVTNNAASPALAANSLRLAIVVTGATNIAAAGSINQGDMLSVLPISGATAYSVTDSLGNLICNRNPNPTLIGYRQTTGSAATASATAVEITALACPVIVPTNRKVKILFAGYDLYSNIASNGGIVTIWDGTVGSGTQLNAYLSQGSATSDANGFSLPAYSYTSGSKTYRAGINRGSGGTATIDAGATNPITFAVELI